MHEMGIALQVVRIVEQSLPPGEALKVKSVRLRLGKLTAVVPASLRLCLEVVTGGTVMEGAELEFVEVPVVLRCRDCWAETEVERPPLACGVCGGNAVDVIGGREMIVESIEVEELDPGAKTGSEKE